MLRSKLENGAGKKNRKVFIDICTNGEASESGEVAPVYEYRTWRWAEMVSSSGREITAAMQAVPMVNAILKVGYDSFTKGITARDRLRIGSDRILNIAGVFNENETNEKIVLWCVEVNG